MSDLPSNPIQVVVVDDDPGTMRWLTICIERHCKDKAQVKGFVDPVEACRWLDQNICEILVTDLQMPAINGLELARHARVRSPLIQVIFVSAEPSVDTVLQAAQDGAQEFLLKPVDAAALIDQLAKAAVRFGRWQETLADTLGRSFTPS